MYKTSEQTREFDPPKSVVVILPAHNEGRAIGNVLSAIPSHVRGMPVTTVVVDDGSTDETGRIAAQHGSLVIRHFVNAGVGTATRTGLKAAIILNADIVVTMDSDGQHDPAEIDRLVGCLLDNQYDVVIGSRILQPRGMPVSRIAANLLLNAITYIVYGKVVSDSQSGFKTFSRKALYVLDLKSSGYEICSEIIGEIVSHDLVYKSLPIKAVYTKYSRAKGQHFLNGINLILEMFVRMLRRV